MCVFVWGGGGGGEFTLCVSLNSRLSYLPLLLAPIIAHVFISPIDMVHVLVLAYPQEEDVVLIRLQLLTLLYGLCLMLASLQQRLFPPLTPTWPTLHIRC